MSIGEPASAGPLPDAALFDALLADQGLTFLSAARREKALADHLAARPSLLRLRAAVTPFVEGVEPATAVAFLENYDLEAIRT
jgi:hypothetical protein